MKRSLQERWPWFQEVRGMRLQLLDILSNADLAFSPGGQNMTLGALVRHVLVLLSILSLIFLIWAADYTRRANW